MKSSWKIGRIAGIDIQLHFTFLLLLAWAAISAYFEHQQWREAVRGLLLMLALFGIVVLHEFGHALAARHFGIRTKDITLLPIGGVARLERIPEQPRQELIVALAGPAVNVVLALVLFLLVLAAKEPLPVAGLRLAGDSWLGTLLKVNISLAVFNLLPAFPMDGGRVLRALLAMRMDYVRATRLAARVGQAFAWILGFVGLFQNSLLLFVALFVWIGAAREAEMAEVKSVLAGLTVQDVMLTEFRVLAPRDPVAVAVEHVLSGGQHDFPVLDDGRVVGVLTRAALVSALAKNGEADTVGAIMQRDVPTAGPAESVEAVLSRLREEDGRVLPILEGQRLVGMFTPENLGEFLMIQAALREAHVPVAHRTARATITS